MKNTLVFLLALTIINTFGQEPNPESFKSLRESHFKGDINLYYNPVLDHYDISVVFSQLPNQ